MPEVHLIMHLCLALVGDTSTGLGGKKQVWRFWNFFLISRNLWLVDS